MLLVQYLYSCLWSSYWRCAVQSGGGVLILEPGPDLENGTETQRCMYIYVHVLSMCLYMYT